MPSSKSARGAHKLRGDAMDSLGMVGSEERQRYGTRIAVMAIVFHFCAFASIFDIYFRSPITPGLEAVPAPPGSQARRLVIMVADGARADMFFQVHNGTELAPHLRSRILSGQASWGVSHTRVPTESRPCHASIFGGIYEDPSAVTKGWQQNPVEFDTLLNVSTAAFAYGSPDVIPLFAKGLPHVSSETYPVEWEDFSSQCHGGERGCRR